MILRYLSGTKDNCPCLGGNNVSILGYTSCSYNRKSTSRYIFFSLWEVTSLGDLASKNVLRCLSVDHGATSEACKEDIWFS
mgnify:CR=1 FL=1